MLDELEKVLYFDTTEQCLSYDTTFQLGDFYVSALIFRHITFRENPCMPSLLILLQSRETTVAVIRFYVWLELRLLF